MERRTGLVMMSIQDRLKQELSDLVRDGYLMLALDLGQKKGFIAPEDLYDGYVKAGYLEPVKSKKPSVAAKKKAVQALAKSFASHYETWYSQALVVVQQLIPDRTQDFRDYYKQDRRKELSYATYTLSDYLIGLTLMKGFGAARVPEFDITQAAFTKFQQQLAILQAAESRFESALLDIRTLLQADIFDSELDSARELVRNGFLRAGGIIAGVVLERHLLEVASAHKVTVRRVKTISSLNDALKDASVLQLPEWRRIQHLGDIRNLCGHVREREPSADEVNGLIDGVDKVVKTII
jgi:hypothetical protein